MSDASEVIRRLIEDVYGEGKIELIDELVLQVADQDLWRESSRPPAFPEA